MLSPPLRGKLASSDCYSMLDSVVHLLGPLGPTVTTWHSCTVLTPAIVIDESPSMHLLPDHFLTIFDTVLFRVCLVDRP